MHSVHHRQVFVCSSKLEECFRKLQNAEEDQISPEKSQEKRILGVGKTEHLTSQVLKKI